MLNYCKLIFKSLLPLGDINPSKYTNMYSENNYINNIIIQDYNNYDQINNNINRRRDINNNNYNNNYQVLIEQLNCEIQQLRIKIEILNDTNNRSKLHEIQSLLFEEKEKIPDGLYLALMNLTL